MIEHTENSSFLMLSVNNSRLGRAPVARIDMTFRRARCRLDPRSEAVGCE